jgi:hypothetical protein
MAARRRLSLHVSIGNVQTDFYFILSLLYSLHSRAEEADKCPGFVSRWIESESAWAYLSTTDVLLFLLQFSVVYSVAAGLIYFFLRNAKHRWPKYIPVVFTALVVLDFVMDLIPQEQPCSRFFLLKEMPANLFWIEIGFSFVLIAVPFLLSLALLLKRAKEPAAHSS